MYKVLDELLVKWKNGEISDDVFYMTAEIIVKTKKDMQKVAKVYLEKNKGKQVCQL